MTNGDERHTKALEAARDVVKQLVTIEAALLTFGISFVQNISKSRGPTGWIDVAAVALLASLVVGVFALFQVVGETHSSGGTINDHWVRGAIGGSMVGLVIAAVCIAVYVIQAPKPLPT